VSTSAIAVSHLSKVFPVKKWWGFSKSSVGVLQDVSLDIPHGEIFGLLGANGAGKTTLVEILATNLLPTSGVARICGQDVAKDTDRVRYLLGYCPASVDSFFPRLSALENLIFFATLYDLDSAAARSRARELLELLGLHDVSGKSFQQLSLGMKQRLGLARALLIDPPVLLLDEPTRSLDPSMQRELHRLFRQSFKEKLHKTVLLVTHSFEEVSAVCDRVAILNCGRILACGTQQQVISASGGRNLADAFEYFAGCEIGSQESLSAAHSRKQ
jgi:ABC-2 type transport system ATP-binding protein